MSKYRKSFAVATFLTFVVVVQAFAGYYSTEDLGDITNTRIFFDDSWHLRPGITEEPVSSLIGPFPVEADLAAGSEIVSVMLHYGSPDASNMSEIPMDVTDTLLSGEIPAIDPSAYNYCKPVWPYAFHLVAYNAVGENVEGDERMYDPTDPEYPGEPGGDPYLFFIENPSPNQSPVADPGGPYHVDRWEDLVVDGSASTDPEGSPLAYAWDVWAEWTDYEATPYVWDDEFDDGSGPNPTFSFDENGEYNIRLLVEDECGEGNVAQTTIMVYDPHVVVIRDDDHIAALNWREGIDLTLSIDGADISTKPSEYLNEGDGFGQNWPPEEIGFDVVAGMDVTVSSNDGTVRSHIVRDHVIDAVDYDADTVTGWAQPSTYVRVRVDEPYWEEIVAWAAGVGEPDEGMWFADFGALGVDLTPEVQVSALQQNEDDSSHTLVFAGHPPDPCQPWFTVQPDHRWADGHCWPLGVAVTLTIDDDTDPGNGTIHQDTQTAGPAPWNPEESVVFFEFGQVEEVARGQYVSMSDGDTTKDMWIADLYMDAIDAAAETVSGRGPADGWVGIWINSDGMEFFREVQVGDVGDWIADFAGEPINYNNIEDARVVFWDEDGDETMAHLPEPPAPPVLHAVPEHPEVHGHEWQSDAFVTLDITRPSTGESFSASKYVYEDPWCGDPCFDLKELWELQEGDVVTMSDDLGYSATVHVAPVAIAGVDLAADTVSGTASAFADVWVSAHVDEESTRHVTADASGNWSADFSVPGDEEFEWAVVDLVPGIGGRAIRFENPEPDDGTLAYWPSGPEFLGATFSENPALIGTPVTIEAVFQASAFGADYCQIMAMELLVFDGDPPTTVPMDLLCDGPLALGTVSYLAPQPGVYPLAIRGFLSEEEWAEEFIGFLVVYDPDGGFVTGGGWIWSPAGAYEPDPSLEGKASFGFVSKYKKGASVPTGNTVFQFHVADLTFESSSYEWLVVAGQKAIYKGVGTINDEGGYRFMLSAIDGDLQGGFDTDRFRIRIWHEDETGEEVVVYDNQLGDYADADPTTELGGGSIVIHTAK